MNINFIEELGKAIEKTLSKPQNINGIENEEIGNNLVIFYTSYQIQVIIFK